jgi:hypothetical protein
MTNEERDLIARFISRVAGSPQGGGFLAGPGGSVPQSQPALPPIDREADAFIAQQFQQYPEARYRITQTALVQEAAFAEAQNRIRRLEWELQQTQQAAQQASQQSPQQQKGFFGSLFGGGGGGQGQQRGFGGQSGYGGQQFQPTSPPPQPQYPPNYQPGMFQQRGGSGFLGSALTTAAGVAGGMVVGNALMGAFSGHGGGEGLLGGSSASAAAFDGAGTDPTAGYSNEASAADPFAGGGQSASYDDGSGFGGPVQQASYDQGGDPGGFDQGGGGFDSGGFDDNA